MKAVFLKGRAGQISVHKSAALRSFSGVGTREVEGREMDLKDELQTGEKGV